MTQRLDPCPHQQIICRCGRTIQECRCPKVKPTFDFTQRCEECQAKQPPEPVNA